MLENSTGSDVEQCTLQSQLVRLLEGLASGRRSDGAPFAAVTDMHGAVVTSDLGDAGLGSPEMLAGETGCSGVGDDGLLDNRGPRACAELAGTYAFGSGRDTCCADAMACAASYPPYLALGNELTAAAASADLACLANPGAGGCLIEQPLEAALKALWPSSDTSITFAHGAQGHGDGASAGFLRTDPEEPSLLLLLLLSDEDDCSTPKDEVFPKANPDPSDPLLGLDSRARCASSEASLYQLDRYVDGLRALRPGNDDLLFFAAITGVPVELVDDAATTDLDFEDDAERDAFYASILEHPDMQLRVDAGRLAPACVAELAYREGCPARRVVELARRLGEGSALRSMCETHPDGSLDYGRAVDFIRDRIATQLQALNR